MANDDEVVRPESKWSRFGEWLNRQQFLIQGIVVLGGVGCCAGFAIALFLSIGHISALGWTTAWTLYGNVWLTATPIGALAGVAMACFLWFVVSSTSLIDSAVRAVARRIPSKLRRVFKVVAWIGFIAAIGGIVAAIGAGAARERRATFKSPRVASAESAADASAAQKRALATLSSDAKRLLRELDTTEARVTEARQHLRGTLATLDRQYQAAENAETALRDINMRQVLVQQQLTDVQRALAGRTPLTRADLERTQRSGLLQGILIGIATSVVATYLVRLFGIWPQLWRRIRKKG